MFYNLYTVTTEREIQRDSKGDYTSDSNGAYVYQDGAQNINPYGVQQGETPEDAIATAQGNIGASYYYYTANGPQPTNNGTRRLDGWLCGAPLDQYTTSVTPPVVNVTPAAPAVAPAPVQ